MTIISSREFRDNQKKYFDLVDNNEQIIVQRGKTKSYRLIPIVAQETLMTEAEYFNKIEKSIQQSKKGKLTDFNNLKDFKTFLDS